MVAYTVQFGHGFQNKFLSIVFSLSASTKSAWCFRTHFPHLCVREYMIFKTNFQFNSLCVYYDCAWLKSVDLPLYFVCFFFDLVKKNYTQYDFLVWNWTVSGRKSPVLELKGDCSCPFIIVIYGLNSIIAVFPLRMALALNNQWRLITKKPN